MLVCGGTLERRLGEDECSWVMNRGLSAVPIPICDWAWDLGLAGDPLVVGTSGDLGISDWLTMLDMVEMGLLESANGLLEVQEGVWLRAKTLRRRPFCFSADTPLPYPSIGVGVVGIVWVSTDWKAFSVG